MSTAARLVDRLVSEQDILDYEANGCVRIAGVFDAATCAQLTLAIDSALHEFDTSAFKARATDAKHQNPPSLHRGDGQVQLRNFAQHVAVIRDWLYHSIAGELVARLLRSRSVRFWMDATFVKEGCSTESATPWHNDECTFPFRGDMMPSFWVALTDVAMDNAPLVTLRGSNRDPWRYHSPMSNPAAFEVEHIPWSHLERRVAQADAPKDIWPCRQGDVLLIHPKTIHASLPRTAQQQGRRIALTTRWLGDDVRWAPNSLSIRIPTLENSAMMRVGEPPPAALFPVIWPQSVES
ncbi:MAG: phytanoyl-CoA dioxygenase family protein [Gammaproteobacteria bacterium]|jgi:ectoine hydroxylase-related dioxygenase (phytanoyl-CoA dioxygenase family)